MKSYNSNLHSNILVVDDEESIRITLREILRDEGYTVSLAEDAAVAKDILGKGEIDVVLADIIMPRITGINLLKSIKDVSPRIQVIMMTGEPTVETASEAVRTGAFDYLTKPINKERLLKIVANAVKIKAIDDERRRLEKENRQYQKNLEKLVQKRTKELELSNKNLGHVNSRLHMIVETTKRLTNCKDTQQFGMKILQEFGQQMHASGGSLYFVEEDGLKLNHSLDPGHAPYFLPFPLLEKSILKKVMEDGKPLLLEDVQGSGNYKVSGWHGYKNGSLLAFPMVVVKVLLIILFNYCIFRYLIPFNFSPPV
jgi:DNA-binding response OmpR family regulator